MTNRGKGISFAAVGATLWGINGAFADIVFSQFNAPVTWVVGTRLLISGLLILLYAKLMLKQEVFAIMKNRSSLTKLILFSLLGMVSSQFVFFLSIEINGAGLATILQFTSPIFIYLFLLLRGEKIVYIQEIIYIFIAIIGVVLIVTKGEFGSLDISILGLLVGIGSAVAVAFYTLQPRDILKEFGSPIVVGWGMFLGGLVFQLVQPIWQPNFTVNGQVVIYMAFIIVVGTALAFSLFLASVNYIDASLSNILAALEPLVANVLTVIVLNQTWTLVQIIGMVAVTVGVILFANYSNKVDKYTKQVDDLTMLS